MRGQQSYSMGGESFITRLCEAGRPARQDLTGLLRTCILQRFAHLARSIPPSQTDMHQLERMVCEPFERIKRVAFSNLSMTGDSA